MVIGEALSALKDLDKKRAFLKERLLQNVFILQDEQNTVPNVDAIVNQYSDVCGHIAELKERIMRTNATSTVAVGVEGTTLPDMPTLSRLLKEIELVKEKENTYRQLVIRVGDRSSRFHGRGFGEQAINLVPNFNETAETYLTIADGFRQLARELEKVLIKANWQTELV